MTVGQKIKKIRRSKEISQKQLALQINKSESTFKKYENGEVAITVDVLMDIAEVLEVNPSILLNVDEVNIIDLIKEKYGLYVADELLEHDINTYLEFLKFKYVK